MKVENPKAIWRRRGPALYPANEEAMNMLRSIKPDAEVPGEFHAIRSVQQLKLYWSLMRLVVDQGIFPTIDAASIATKIAAGHVDMSIAPDTGEITYVPKHIRFGSLSAADFNEVFTAMLNVVCKRWLGSEEFAVARELAYEMQEKPENRALGKLERKSQ